MVNDLRAPEEAVYAALTGTQKPVALFLLGTVDAGKTSTATALANRFHEQQLRVAVVDADVGQSDIGPPCCIGVGLMVRKLHRLADLPPCGLYFVGDSSPANCTRECVHGAVAAAQKASTLGAEVVIVDSTGWVTGEAAKAFKLREIAALNPAVVLAIAREDELDHILADLTRPVLRIGSSQYVRTRTPEERRTLRERAYNAYFKTARTRVVTLASFAWPPAEGSIVGLYSSSATVSGSAEILGLGIVSTLDYERGTAVVTTPVPVADRDGTQIAIGRIKPGAVRLIDVRGRYKELRSDRPVHSKSEPAKDTQE